MSNFVSLTRIHSWYGHTDSTVVVYLCHFQDYFQLLSQLAACLYVAEFYGQLKVIVRANGKAQVSDHFYVDIFLSQFELE